MPVEELAAELGIHRNPTAGPLARFTIDWWKLLHPDSFWPIPYSTDQIFQLIAYMLELSQPWDGSYYSPAGLMLGTGAINICAAGTFPNNWRVRNPVEEAREHIQRAILGGMYLSPGILAWRRDCLGVTFNGAERALVARPIIVPRPAYTPEAGPLSVHDTGIRLAKLLACEGREQLHDSHNKYHPEAKSAINVQMGLTRAYPRRISEEAYPDRHERWKAANALERKKRRLFLTWSFAVNYGYPNDGGWTIPLATQGDGETWLDAMLRAEARLAELAGPGPRGAK